MPYRSTKITKRIEAACEAGCDTVRASIQLLEQGANIELTDDLTEEERQIVLKELKAIMAVYDDIS